MLKADVLARICDQRIIALSSVDNAEQLQVRAEALAAGGIHCLELSMTCPAVPDFIAATTKAMPDFFFGVGTIVDTDTARRAILAGARFLSTPAVRPEVILLCRRHHVPVICGVNSRSEIAAAIEAGADAIKLYPSQDDFGPAYVRDIRAEFPTVKLFPVGGVTAANAVEFIHVGADAVFVASGLRPLDAPVDFDPTQLSTRARELVIALAPVASER
ncbi:bifunctional 4-hydroxy-2-oxoglutarate aldolase/2-dehydro-3-deoxy-phosphogluconate aldolase [Synoicihabitans lomoniglobus]|uniref:Bifunctional 4-hydroxy-2-oxoglutarate aldolase/2-dehydro-3-deoxy-phosphogluconate aldolase n=1 Tax=Synoicihabitans lomoniglobus TaxID=2909285 RepID=A0AAF0CQU0_9BACT|nr:bifunctional 4-hydroxy-2-oxoglutarate aldolase/2-dehydro-3-deoxy-phosphogluconate aldolase [Opitutaceae bacterium LMO-M01]WED66385.1 bifunctional 4-hydroxy-2-oxoglutarate aldolase/2-dehydro-3-deoxy-phosphogluconate aldolase [Opitutaceae bacterium LMO-M01]